MINRGVRFRLLNQLIFTPGEGPLQTQHWTINGNNKYETGVPVQGLQLLYRKQPNPVSL